MTEISANPKITVEEEKENEGILIIGEKSPLAQTLREILKLKGVEVSDPQNFQYLFQTDNLDRIEFFMVKAKLAKAKFFLLLDETTEKSAQKAEKNCLKFSKKEKMPVKIIKLSGFAGQEIEAVEKILKITFSQTSGEIISLRGAQTFMEKIKPKDSLLRKKIKTWAAIAGLSLFLLISPFVFILCHLLLGTWALNNTKGAILNSNFSRSKIQAQFAEGHFSDAKNIFNLTSPAFFLLGKGKEAREIDTWLEIGQNLSIAAGHLTNVAREGQKLALLVLGQKQGELDETLLQISKDVNLADNELALVEAQGKNLDQVNSLRKNLVGFKNLLPFSAWLLGLKENRTYLVLLQNNFELRPGGGFIGSLGFLTLTSGKLDFRIEDVYTSDGQLKGHVEPPKPIKDYLNQIHWYLRDSNFDPDFSVNAQKAAWFLEKERGIQVDGVIAVDLSLVQKLLTLTGPIDLSDYQEKITADNFFLKAETHSEAEFFPGSSQKKDFLGSLTNAIFVKFTNNNEQSMPWLGLAKVISESADEKHFFVFVNNRTAQKIMSSQGWSGEVRNVKCPASAEATAGKPMTSCIEDYLMVVDANLGVNKANYFIKRKVQDDLNLTQERLLSRVTIDYENTSPLNVSFGGVYKNYLRVLVPFNSNLEKISLDGQDISSDKIDRENLDGKNSFGFLVEVLPGTKKKVEVSFNQLLGSSGSASIYQLLVQKQAGTDKDSLIIASNFGLSYNGNLLEDRMFTVNLKQ